MSTVRPLSWLMRSARPTGSTRQADPQTTPLTRRALLVAFVLCQALAWWQRPGLISADTKLDLTANPIGFLARAANLWDSQLTLGQVQNQAYGYFFPHGSFFALGSVLHIPGWMTQRMWWGLLLFVGFLGVVRLAKALRIGNTPSQVFAAIVYILSPRVLTTLGAISSETTPMMLAPWVLAPVVVALSSPNITARQLRICAGASAVAVALMGAVNAVATLEACAVAGLWWAMHRPSTRWLRFSLWWIPLCVLACAWWLGPLIILGKVSPPFLDFIESSRVTTEWTSLVEVLRGTDSWTAFVSPERVAGSVLVTQPAAVVVTTIVAAAGLAGLTMRRMPYRGRLVTVLMVGIIGLAIGYVGGLGSPVADAVRSFLDGPGAALRNVHKLEPFVRIPLVLGVAHLVARVPLPGNVPWRQFLRELAHIERSKRLAATLALALAVTMTASLALMGNLTTSGPYKKIPDYWYQAANWLYHNAQNSHGGPAQRALIVPGAPFGSQVWGLTRDEPMQPLAKTPWAIRDAIPLTPPGAIRALDSVQRLFADGRPSPGLADTLLQQGIGYVVLRTDLDPDTSRSARPVLALQALTGSPGITKVAQFGTTSSVFTNAKPAKDVVIDDGLRPQLPPIEIFKVRSPHRAISTAGASTPPTLGPYTVDLDNTARVYGGPGSLLRLSTMAAERGRTLGTSILTANAQAAGLPPAPTVVTDSPMNRETDFGRVDDHSSSLRAKNDERRTQNAAPDYPVPGQPLVYGKWVGATLTSSGSASDATQLGVVSPASSLAAIVDGDPHTAWVSSGLSGGVGKWVQFNFDHPYNNVGLRLTLGRGLGSPVDKVLVSTATGSTISPTMTPGKPVDIQVPPGPSTWIRITAYDTDNHTAGTQFAITDASLTNFNTNQKIPVRFQTILPPLPPDTPITGWTLGQDLIGRQNCVNAPTTTPCSGALSLRAEESGLFQRTLSVPSPIDVRPTVYLRAQDNPSLGQLLLDPNAVTAVGASDVADSRGTGAAAVDGDVKTSWTAPESVNNPGAPSPKLTLHLPKPERVGGLDVIGALSNTPAHPELISVNLGTGRQIRKIDGDNPIELDPATTSEISITILKWRDELNINSLGFTAPVPPGIAEVKILGPDHRQIPSTFPPSLDRPITVDCAHGPVLTIGTHKVRMSIRTTARQLRDGALIQAHPCSDAPIHLDAGSANIALIPGDAFFVDSMTLDSARSQPVTTPIPTVISQWTSSHRVVTVAPSKTARILVVPESVNPAWVAHADATRLTPITVNGWQQGWIIPAGVSGTIHLDVPLNKWYRTTLFGGLALLTVVFAAAFIRKSPSAEGARSIGVPAQPWLQHRTPRRVVSFGGLAVAIFLIAGWGGLIVGLGTTAVALVIDLWAKKSTFRSNTWTQLPVIAAFSLLSIAGCILARGPWRSKFGYNGSLGIVQGLALAALVIVCVRAARKDTPPDP